jgi:hypothetical protein
VLVILAQDKLAAILRLAVLEETVFVLARLMRPVSASMAKLNAIAYRPARPKATATLARFVPFKLAAIRQCALAPLSVEVALRSEVCCSEQVLSMAV